VNEEVDIVERLRRHRCVTGIRTVIDDAADEIERLRNLLAEQKSESMTFHAENERLRTALRDWIAGTQTHAKRANEGGSR
jgi:regulator of replication initiation timing